MDDEYPTDYKLGKTNVKSKHLTKNGKNSTINLPDWIHEVNQKSFVSVYDLADSNGVCITTIKNHVKQGLLPTPYLYEITPKHNRFKISNQKKSGWFVYDLLNFFNNRVA